MAALSGKVLAQGEANIWHFGQNAGLDFNGGSPVALGNGAINQLEGCATISDANGSLLFYTDGLSVWNANHVIMVNGTGLMGNPSAAQSAVIVPKPNNPAVYYIFTVPSGCGSFGNGLRYSEVDMSLAGGLGAVTGTKNVFLTLSTCEKITAVVHGTGNSYWVVCQSATADVNAFEVTAAGVNTTPVISNSGAAPYLFCYMKASPDGQWIARGGTNSIPARLMEFDNLTGQIGNSVPIPVVSTYVYGLDFSKSSNYLYLNHGPIGFLGPGSLIQYDLSLTSLTAIASSATSVGSPPQDFRYAIQLAPDGKIYGVGFFTGSLFALNEPDSAGPASNFQTNAVTLAFGTSNRLGLPTFIQSFFQQVSITVEDTCELDTTLFTASNPSLDSVFWNFDDTASGSFNDASGDSVFHVFSAPGTYQVTALSYFTNNTGFIGFVDSTLDTITVTIHPLPQIDLGNDTVLCEGDSLSILNSNTVLGMNYLWIDSSTSEFLPIDTAGTYWVETSTLCGTAYDTITIDSVLPAFVDFGPDTILCVGDTLTFEVEVAYGSYLWQDNDTSNVYDVTTSGQYAVTATGLCNTSIDTINVYFVEPPEYQSPFDTTFCNGQTLDLLVSADSATYLWNTGSLDSTITVGVTDTFLVSTTNACGTFEDTTIVTIDFPLNTNLGADTVLCVGTSYNLFANLPGNNQYLWQDSSTNESMLVDAPGTYWLRATNTCDSYSDTIEVDYEVPPAISLPDRVQFCDGESYLASVPFSRADYLWSNGSMQPEITIYGAGLYHVTVTNLCGVDEDSVLAIVDFPLEVDIGSVFELCEGQTITLDATAPNDPVYEWNNSSQEPTAVVSGQGYYRVTVTNSCGSYSDEVAVYMQPKPKPELPGDTAICGDEEWTIKLSDQTANFLWQDGSVSRRYTVSDPGLYLLTISNACGKRTDSMEVIQNDIPEVSLGVDTVYCPSVAELFLDPSVKSDHELLYSWSTGAQGSTLEVEAPGTYELTITDPITGCFNRDVVFVGDCPVAIWIPNTFSPNRDGINDVFLPHLSYVTDYELKVFDRWGHQIFTTINPNVGWDGTDQGILVPSGVYVYSLSFFSDVLGRETLTGSVSLMR